MERVRFDVGGQIFAINRALLSTGSCAKLATLSKLERDVIVVDRPPQMFAAILALCQTGELHVPRTCCPAAFLRELDYWGIKTDQLATCCYFKLHRFMSEQHNLKKFETSMHTELEPPKKSSTAASASLRMIRSRIWSLVDFREKTVIATLYFAVSLLMVLVSICNLAFSTDPNFRRNMTNCERYEYMKQFDMDDLHLVEDMLKADCGNDTSPSNATYAVTPPPFEQLGDDDEDFVEVAVEVEAPTTPDPLLEMCKENITGTNGNLTESDLVKQRWQKIRCSGGFRNDMRPPVIMLKRIKIPNFKIPIEMFRVLELVTTAYFTLDISVRLMSCPSYYQYFTSVVNIADSLALLGVYLNWLLTSLRPKEQYELNWFDLLEYLQMLRSLRLFRLVMSFNISKVLVYSVGQSVKDGFIMVLLLVAGMCTFSICLYIAEDKYTIRTIPDAWYWSVITMTTVGYGDVAPKTPFGRLVACVCSVSGVLVFALTVPLFVNQFMTLYQYADMKMAEEEGKDSAPEDRFDYAVARANNQSVKRPMRENAIKLRAESVRMTKT